MKTLFLLLSVIALCGCSKETATAELSAEDVAWATGWNIFKKPLKAIVPEPVYSIGIVVLNEEGAIVSEGPWLGAGNNPPFSSDSVVTFALKKTGDTVECKLRVGGVDVSSTLDTRFGNFFGWNSGAEIVDEILPLATDAQGVPVGGQALMKAKGRKIGLKFYRKPRAI